MLSSPGARAVDRGLHRSSAWLAASLLLLTSCGDDYRTQEVPVDDIVVGSDGITINASVTTDDCGTPQRLILEEQASEVIVTAEIRERNGACADRGTVHTLSATLGQPLGERSVRSG